eukprot:gene31056-37534_t
MNRAMYNAKPEQVLKRANDLINSAVGTNGEKEKRMALEQLHNVITDKRRKNAEGGFGKIYEQLMKRHLELCVDLKDHATAKDGLHQYRNLCVATDPASLETVIVYLLDLADAKASTARQRANKISLATAARVKDMEQEESPESIMLASMTEEGSRERTDREMVSPWLKFLWEVYRAILDLLFRLPKLEKVYHKTCEKAFKFCQEYSRILEFRRLSDAISQQLGMLQRPPVTARGTKTMIDWNAESIDLHLQTRCAQLEVAASLELWHEAMKILEDMSSIVAMSKKAPRAKHVLVYYEKLAKIFSVADHKLYCAIAWYKLYQWTGGKGEEKGALASTALVAALTVPSIKDIYNTHIITDDEVVEKQTQLNCLQEFQAVTSRGALLADMVSSGLLEDVQPELKALYEALETKFSPFTLCKTVAPILEGIQKNGQLAAFIPPLHRIVVLKLLQQLSKAYSSVRLSFVYKLLADVQGLSPVVIERYIMEGLAHRQIFLKLNHLQSSITFSTPMNAPNALDDQLSLLGQALSMSVQQTQPKAADRKELIQAVLAVSEEDVDVTNARRELIEQRKESFERIQEEKAREEKRLKELEEERRQKAEKERLAAEAEREKDEKRRKEREKMDLLKLQKDLERYNIFMSEEELGAMKPVDRIGLLTDAQNKALAAKEEELRKLAEFAKRLDHTERALRIESSKAVLAAQANQAVIDAELLARKTAELRALWEKKHAEDLLEKARLEKMQPHRSKFEGEMVRIQRAQYEKSLEVLRKKKIIQKRDQIVAIARQEYFAELERIEKEEEKERERRAKEDRERLEKEQHERLRRQRELEEERERDLERMNRQVEEALAKQQREKEEQAKKAATEGAKPATAAAPAAQSGGASKYVPPSSRAPVVPPPTQSAANRRDEPPTWRKGGGGDEERRAAPAPTASREDARGDDKWDRSGANKPAAEPWRPSRAYGAGGDRREAPKDGPRDGARGEGKEGGAEPWRRPARDAPPPAARRQMDKW